MMEAVMGSPRDSEKRRYKIEGTNLLTDKVGLEKVKKCMDKFVGREVGSTLQKEMTAELRELLHTLKEEGRLFHKDGYGLR